MVRVMAGTMNATAANMIAAAMGMIGIGIGMAIATAIGTGIMPVTTIATGVGTGIGTAATGVATMIGAIVARFVASMFMIGTALIRAIAAIMPIAIIAAATPRSG